MMRPKSSAAAVAGLGRLAVSSSARRWRRIALACLLGGAVGWLPARGHSAGLDCPEIAGSAVHDLLSEEQIKLVAAGNNVELANEISYAINKLQIERPNLSYAQLTNVLIAAYCPVVANLKDLTPSEKWDRMRQFDRALQQQLAGNGMPQGSAIIANVPLPPAVYRELRSQAAGVGQTPTQLMTAILSRAAGK
jgi:hypothetical protein